MYTQINSNSGIFVFLLLSCLVTASSAFSEEKYLAVKRYRCIASLCVGESEISDMNKVYGEAAPVRYVRRQEGEPQEYCYTDISGYPTLVFEYSFSGGWNRLSGYTLSEVIPPWIEPRYCNKIKIPKLSKVTIKDHIGEIDIRAFEKKVGFPRWETYFSRNYLFSTTNNKSGFTEAITVDVILRGLDIVIFRYESIVTN